MKDHKTDKEEILLVGAGGHARSLAESPELRIRGYFDIKPQTEFPYEWLGKDEDAKDWIEKGFTIHISFVYQGFPIMKARRKIIEKFESMNARFASIVFPSAIVTSGSEIGEGAAILNGAIINRAKLDENVIINTGAIIEHDCHIGENTFIGPGAIIGGGVEIGKDCFIGLGAKIKNGIRICDGVTVGMGCVVLNDLKEPGIYHGFPLKRARLPKNGLIE